MKHLTILSLSAAVVLFIGAQFKNPLNNFHSNAKTTEQVIALQINETKAVSDSLIISEGTKATAKVANSIEQTTIKFIGGLVRSVF